MYDFFPHIFFIIFHVHFSDVDFFHHALIFFFLHAMIQGVHAFFFKCAFSFEFHLRMIHVLSHCVFKHNFLVFIYLSHVVHVF